MMPLEIFFYKLCRLSQAWSNIVFVFDGPNRPSIKRGHKVPVENEVDWYGPCQKIIKDFGYHVHMVRYCVIISPSEHLTNPDL